MKNTKEFARHYLFSVLAGRKGCDIKESVDDYDIVEEIVDELADLIEKRDKQILKGPKQYHFGIFSQFKDVGQFGCTWGKDEQDARGNIGDNSNILKKTSSKKCPVCNKNK